jgi:hypothetical protein
MRWIGSCRGEIPIFLLRTVTTSIRSEAVRRTGGGPEENQEWQWSFPSKG